MNLTLATAKEFVRARIDELPFDASDMLADELDDRNLGTTIEKLLPEAIRKVHLETPAMRIEGIAIDETSESVIAAIDMGVLDLSFLDEEIEEQNRLDVLRVLTFRSADSNITLTDVFDEDSMKGRLQLNKYMRGTPGSPVLVKMADSLAARPHLKYYTTDDDTEAPEFRLTYFPEPELTEVMSEDEEPVVTDESYYFISGNLLDAVLNCLVGQVLMAYKEPQTAEYFFKKNQI